MADDKKPYSHWRQMKNADIGTVCAIAETVHADYPEDREVFAERLSLFPEGCRILEGADAKLGYLVAHPAVLGRPPKLNSLLKRLPDDADTIYVHDLALLPAARGLGAGSAAIAAIANLAREWEFTTLSLVSVNDSAPFWESQGFTTVRNAAIAESLRSYDADARFMVRSLIST